MMALVTGIEIATLVASIFDFCNAKLNSVETFSAFSKTLLSSGISIGWAWNLSSTHWLDLFVLICASLISLLVSSTPITSSPWTEDFPILDFKKSNTLVKGLSFFLTGDLGNFIPFNEGFLNFKLFSFPNIFETLFAGFSSVVFSDLGNILI